MKIRDVLQGLLSGEDFIDHSTGKEDGNAPYHPAKDDCDFCDAWREALAALQTGSLSTFEAGETVELVSGVRGRVMGTELVVRVEVHGPRGHGPFAVGAFRPGDLKTVDAEAFTYWLDTKGGDTWERRESDRLMRIVFWGDHGNGGHPVESPMPWDVVARREATRTFEAVSEWYGPLAQVAKP